MKRPIVFGVVFIVILIVGWYFFTNSYFHLTSTVPADNNNQTADIQPIIIKFNRPLDNLTAKRFNITPNQAGDVKIDGDTLTFTPSVPYNLDTSYRVALRSPAALGGEATTDVTLNFKVVYKDYASLSPDLQKVAVKRNDTFQKKHPVVKLLPRENSHYKIDYVTDDTDNISLSITTYGILNRPSQFAQYKTETLQYRGERLA